MSRSRPLSTSAYHRHRRETERRRQALRRHQALRRRLVPLGTAVVAIVSVTYLGASVVGSARTTASLNTSTNLATKLDGSPTATYRQEVCLTKAARQVVPKGATVYISNDNTFMTKTLRHLLHGAAPNFRSTGAYDTYMMRQLALGLVSWAPFSASPGAAKWSVSYITDTHGASTKVSAGCNGLYIHVSRER